MSIATMERDDAVTIDSYPRSSVTGLLPQRRNRPKHDLPTTKQLTSRGQQRGCYQFSNPTLVSARRPSGFHRDTSRSLLEVTRCGSS